MTVDIEVKEADAAAVVTHSKLDAKINGVKKSQDVECVQNVVPDAADIIDIVAPNTRMKRMFIDHSLMYERRR